MSLEPRKDSTDKVDLPSMVEALQNALHFHKQHIASEVKEIVSTELTQLVSLSHQNLSDFYIKTFSNLENGIKLELQAINYKLEAIDAKSSDIIGRIKALEEGFQQRDNKLNKEFRDITEKTICSEQTITHTSENLKKLEENFLKLNNEIVQTKESFNSNKNTIVGDLRVYLNEHRREIDSARYESECKLQTEVYKLLEKMNEIKHNFDTQCSGRERFALESSNTSGGLKFQENELFEFVQAGLSKQAMETSQLRIRVEKLEISDKACEDFRRGRINR